MIMNPVIFREYDIRGVFNTDFNTDFAYNLGRAIATKIFNTMKERPNIAVGCDARLSSPSLSKAIIEGATSVGADTYDLGLVTSPMNYFATFHYKHINLSLIHI